MKLENLTKINIDLDLSVRSFDDRFSRVYVLVRYVGSSRRVRVFKDADFVLKYLDHMGLSYQDVSIYSVLVCSTLLDFD